MITLNFPNVQHRINDPLHSIHERYRQTLDEKLKEINKQDSTANIVISGGFWGGISEESATRIKTMIGKISSTTLGQITTILENYKNALNNALGNSGNAESRSVLKALDLKLQTPRNGRTQLGGIHMRHLDGLAKHSERSFVEINEDAWDGVTLESSGSIITWLDKLDMNNEEIKDGLRQYQADLETHLNKSFLPHPASRAVLAKIREIINKTANT